jgi:hypothetical protein
LNGRGSAGMSAPVLFSGLSGGARRIVIMRWVVLGATKS